MRIIGLEEHFVTVEVLAGWQALEPRWHDVGPAHSSSGELGQRLADLGNGRPPRWA